MLERLAAVQLLFLVCEEGLERLLHLSANRRNECYQIDCLVYQLLAERHNHDDLLEMHFNHSLADKSCTEEGPERNEEVSARDAGEIKQWIGNLKEDFATIER